MITGKSRKKVVILGIDGLDMRIIEKGMQKGVLPNFKTLQNKGLLESLDTVIPPQSPVAWASFITGTKPAQHGVYDFVKRHPASYNIVSVYDKGSNAYKTTPFWEYLTQHNISSTVLFLPGTYPASKLKGKMLSGMGTPDIFGTQGVSTIFSSHKKTSPVRLKKFIYMIVDKSNPVKTSIQGPTYTVLGKKEHATASLEIEIDAKGREVTLALQGRKFTIKQGEFSNWIPLKLKLSFFTPIHGLAKFYLKSVSPDLELYMSPINIDPRDPVGVISYPKKYAVTLVKEFGPYCTLGLPHFTSAFDENLLDEKAFLQQTDSVFTERAKIYLKELGRFKKGLLVAYFGEADSVQHMFWKRKNIIMKYYEKMDEMIGKTLKMIDKETILIILSDHGFGPLDYEFNVNTWLMKNGYLFLKRKGQAKGKSLSDVNWSKTKAYAVGFNGIFINRKGREGKGIVEEQEAKQLEKELVHKLASFVNPFTNNRIIKKIYSSEDLSAQKDDAFCPDLFVGYYTGTRASWYTAIGRCPEKLLVKRRGKWLGDHLFDVTEVPGIIASNKKLSLKNPSIDSLMPSIYRILLGS